ncbi:protein aubergine-like [Culicoides brevitarsis]|uniref:protein aubergine-like n=1 Tax=Culicoides brevitarsis TaxID=469753 RepID=UPI00307C9343
MSDSERAHGGRRKREGSASPPTDQASGGEEPRHKRPATATTSAIRSGPPRGRRVLHDLVYTRPQAVKLSKKGTTGNAVAIKSNYFKLETRPNWAIYQYRVDFAPEIEVTNIRKAILRGHKNMFDGFLFDGTMLLTSKRLREDITMLTTQRTDGSNVILTIKFIGQVTMTQQGSLQVLNLILRKSMEGLKLQLVGRNFFDAVAKIAIREYRLELWPGYVTSIRQHEYDILMCTEISSKVMRMETLYDILQECMKNFRDYKESFSKIIVGTTVLTDYSNKTYRVDDIDWEQSPASVFSCKDETISYADYYQKRYQIRVRDMRQPLILSRSKERQKRSGQADLIALIPELCRATGLTEDMRSNFRLMKAVAEHTRIGPAQRIRRLLDFNQRLKRTPEAMDVLKEWNMTLAQDLIEFTGRELPPEKIVCNDREIPGNAEADWTRDFRNCLLYTVVHLNNWHLVALTRCQREANDFVRCLQDAVKKMGFTIAQPRVHLIENDRNDEILRAVENCARQDTQLIMLIISNNNPGRYSAIKKRCCVDRAIPTQVIVQKTITPKDGNMRGLMSVATKVAIQLNCKLGAAPWFVKLPLSGLMTVGFDVCHDTKNKAMSYGALVASMDLRSSCRYFSVVSSHHNGEELSNELALNMTKALKEYRMEHNALPSKILFYRDGVAEGQIHYVIEHEIENLRKVLEKHYENAEQELRFAFIVVNKRLNTRVFRVDRNPQPGTVVDDVITLPERYDFFLVSQSVRQGTVSPTSYNVIYDSLQLPPDKMQILTYKQCHLYYNWSGTTRVPAVCQYAHKLAFLVGQHIHQAPHQSLQKSLYFL